MTLDVFAAVFAALTILVLTAVTAHAFIPDTSRWKNPLRTRAEKRRAWQEARDYGRRYGSQ